MSLSKNLVRARRIESELADRLEVDDRISVTAEDYGVCFLGMGLAPLHRDAIASWDALIGLPDSADASDVWRALRELPEAPEVALPASPATDADIAREFWRRFGPIQVHMGEWRGRAAVAELEDDGTWISEALPDGARREEHAAGEDGFVAALERARELVRRG